MTLLEIVQNFCIRTNIPKPNFVVGQFDAQVAQLAGLAQEVVEDLMDLRWNEQRVETAFTTILQEDQGAVSDLAPGFDHFIDGTFFNRTKGVQMNGPLNPQEWQNLKSLTAASLVDTFTIRGGKFLLAEPVTFGETIAFEYVTTFLIKGNDGTMKETFTKDDDTFILPNRLLMAGLRWKWKAEKGLDYAEEFTSYEAFKANALGRNGANKVISMDPMPKGPRPGIVIPAGSWNI